MTGEEQIGGIKGSEGCNYFLADYFGDCES
jgi:hypothetical protein